jgi:hypothetical protein
MDSETAPLHLSSVPSACTSCGRVIGVYEPMIVVSPWGDVAETSVAQCREIDPDADCYHPACYTW